MEIKAKKANKLWIGVLIGLCLICVWTPALIGIVSTQKHNSKSKKMSYAVESLFPVIEAYQIHTFMFKSYNDCVLLGYGDHQWMTEACPENWSQFGYTLLPAEHEDQFHELANKLRHENYLIDLMSIPTPIQFDENGTIVQGVFTVADGGFFGYELIYSNGMDDGDYMTCEGERRSIRKHWDYYICSPL